MAHAVGDAPAEAADGIVESNPNIAIVDPANKDFGGPTTPAARESRRHFPQDLAVKGKPDDVLSKYSKRAGKASCPAFPAPAVMLPIAAPPPRLLLQLRLQAQIPLTSQNM